MRRSVFLGQRRLPMKIRYVTKGWDAEPIYQTIYPSPNLPSITVYDSEFTPSDTGLVDADGNSILRVVEKQPIGFVWYEQHESGSEGDNR